MQGIGPLFNLTVTVENASQKQTALNLCLVFQWDESLYSLSKKIIQVKAGITLSEVATVNGKGFQEEVFCGCHRFYVICASFYFKTTQ